MRTFNTFLNRGAVLFAGMLAGATLTGCPGPKTIGAETDTSDDTDTETSGEQCMEGDIKPADDGCNTCTCIDGQWGCTEIGCAEEGPPM